ncbi:hypothetical protein [Candidatus Nucleicultrix amoebiphila]|uniref:Uncharacterized protein n=1 Tax=Candidatus Nucleicultrix amoebiphila FS5 TaxID=1414854 RepID=A0A1W6N4U4_9PROT|nr:hypothetical protein [Candidatus Nucleicultrix amoebiphila]ARN84788.1 hypothetical protein GQ61_05220 [Candidatus Nucleicultrix amoebiphila FS5]
MNNSYIVLFTLAAFSISSSSLAQEGQKESEQYSHSVESNANGQMKDISNPMNQMPGHMGPMMGQGHPGMCGHMHGQINDMANMMNQMHEHMGSMMGHMNDPKMKEQMQQMQENMDKFKEELEKMKQQMGSSATAK